MTSFGCERAGYTSRHGGQYERQHQSDCQPPYGPAETTNEVVLSLQRCRGFGLVCVMVIENFLFVLLLVWD